MDTFKRYTGNAIFVLLVLSVLWLVISNLIQAFMCPEMTQTELFLHMPKSFVCDWKTTH